MYIGHLHIHAGAATLIPARRVFPFAQGHATSLADLMDRRLRRSGLSTQPLTPQGRELAEHLLELEDRDVVLGFAFHALNALILSVARLDQGRSVASLDRLSELIRQLDQEG